MLVFVFVSAPVFVAGAAGGGAVVVVFSDTGTGAGAGAAFSLVCSLLDVSLFTITQSPVSPAAVFECVPSPTSCMSTSTSCPCVFACSGAGPGPALEPVPDGNAWGCDSAWVLAAVVPGGGVPN